MLSSGSEINMLIKAVESRRVALIMAYLLYMSN